MKPWHGFGLSLLVALSLHAILLLVPRVAGRVDPGAPTVEVSLASLPAGPGIDDTESLAARKGGARLIAPPAVRAATPSAKPAPPPTAAEPPREPSPAATNELPPSREHPPAAPDSSPLDGAPEGPVAVGDAVAGPAVFTAVCASGGPETGAASPQLIGPRGGAGTGGEAPVGAAGSAAAIMTPRPRGEIIPEYPRSARRAGFQGVVTISAFIDETGVVVSAEVLSSSGHAVLDQAALDAVRRALFDPAERGARPVSSRLIIPFRFRLN